jgi:hypothetical protein
VIQGFHGGGMVTSFRTVPLGDPSRSARMAVGITALPARRDLLRWDGETLPARCIVELLIIDAITWPCSQK